MEAMSFLDFLTGFVVCAALVTFLASPVLKRINSTLVEANRQHSEMKAILDVMQWNLDQANRKLQEQAPARAPNGRFVKRGA